MIIDNRRKELIKNSIKHYDFMKRMITNEIITCNINITDNVKVLEHLEKFIEKFKGAEVTNFEYNNTAEDENDRYGYLDFLYNDVSMCVAYDSGNDLVHVTETYEIYDVNNMEFIVEDWLTTSDYTEILNAPKEQTLHDAIADLKYYESNNCVDSYNRCRDEIVNFLKEEW